MQIILVKSEVKELLKVLKCCPKRGGGKTGGLKGFVENVICYYMTSKIAHLQKVRIRGSGVYTPSSMLQPLDYQLVTEVTESEKDRYQIVSKVLVTTTPNTILPQGKGGCNG